jgi:hypothetical protein
MISMSRTQWAPLMLAASVVPLLAVTCIAKPNIGVAVIAAQSSRRHLFVALAVMGVFLAVSLAVRPSWPSSWLIAIRDAPHIRSMLLRPGGFLLLLALLRWRLPEGRLLATMSLVPHTPSLYDVLPLMFVARTLRETLLLAVLTHVLFFSVVTAGPFPTFDIYTDWLGNAAVFVIYLPALVIALLHSAPPAERAVGDSTATAVVRETMWPSKRLDVALLVVLLLGAFALLWLPLVTVRA